MRSQAVLLGFALLLTAVALAPTASADKCYTDGVVQTCTSGVTVSNNTQNCLWGGHWEETTVGPVTYREYVCDPYPRD